MLHRLGLGFQQTYLIGYLVEHKLILSSSFIYEQSDNIHWSEYGHTAVLLKYNLDIQLTYLRGRFAEQKLMLSSNFTCDEINICQLYDFGHTLSYFWSWT